jgi:Sulfotransferase family
MRLARRSGLLFIHVPKTGGTTIEHVLADLVPDIEAHDKFKLKHQTLARALKDDPSRAELFTFGFVRNPWARMVSWWSKIHQSAQQVAAGDQRGRKHVQSRMWQLALGCDNFDEFVDVVPLKVQRVRRPQIDYLTVPGGRRADYIGRTENFDADLRAVLTRLGLPIPEIPRRNESPHGDYREYYSDRSRRQVEELFQRDIRSFGYQF